MINKIIVYLKNWRYKKIIKELKIGKNCRILTNYSNFGSEPYLVKIGDNCTITSGVKFLTHDGSLDVIFKYKNLKREEKNLKYDKLGTIIVGNNVFIGINSIIMPGVEIGDNVIIGAGSVVTKNIVSKTVVAGVPARKIYELDEYIEKIKNNLFLINHKNKKEDTLFKMKNKVYQKIE
ncbi:MAG: acyltransferase [Cetobacterium sp.]